MQVRGPQFGGGTFFDKNIYNDPKHRAAIQELLGHSELNRKGGHDLRDLIEIEVLHPVGDEVAFFARSGSDLERNLRTYLQKEAKTVYGVDPEYTSFGSFKAALAEETEKLEGLSLHHFLRRQRMQRERNALLDVTPITQTGRRPLDLHA